jgi:hypothetical protein
MHVKTVVNCVQRIVYVFKEQAAYSNIIKRLENWAAANSYH